MARTQVFTHMAPRDIPLFAAYVLTPEGQDYQAWEFDVLVGDPEEPGSHYPASARRQALYLNSLKIDAVGWFYDTPKLIECKPVAGCGAIGQVLVYQKWYQLIFDRTPSMLIVCRQMTRQIQIMCDIMGIGYKCLYPADDYTITKAISYVKPLIRKRSILPLFQAVS